MKYPAQVQVFDNTEQFRQSWRFSEKFNGIIAR